MRCDGRLVSDGDTFDDVIRACGQPSFQDDWQGEGAVVPMQQWTYNSGPYQLIEQILFRGGRVVSIQSAGYGFTVERDTRDRHCEPASIQPGLSKYRLLYTCGAPDESRGWYVNSTRYGDGMNGYRYRQHVGRFVYRERWLYDFGANRLPREIWLENARVVAIDTP